MLSNKTEQSADLSATMGARKLDVGARIQITVKDLLQRLTSQAPERSPLACVKGNSASRRHMAVVILLTQAFCLFA